MTVRYQMGADPAPETAVEPSIANRSTGTQRWSMRDGVETTETAPRAGHAPADVSDKAAMAKGILATAHDAWRAHVPAHEINGQTRVSFGGTTTTVDVAARMGLITKNGNGQWVEAGGGGNDGSDPKAPSKPPEAPEGDGEDDAPNPRLDDQSEAYLTEAFKGATQETIGAGMAYIEAGGEMPEASTHLIAARLGIDPAVASERIERVTAAYTAEATTALAATFGAELAAEVFEWAKEEQRGKLNEAARAHFNTGKPVYESLGRDYVIHLAKSDPERIVQGLRDAGAEARLTETRKIVFKEKGSVEREFVAAVVSGHIFGKKIGKK